MANLVRIRMVGIYYTSDNTKTDPNNIEATYAKANEKAETPVSFFEFVPNVDVFVDEFVDRSMGVIEITPNQLVRHVPGLRDFIAQHLSNKRVLSVGATYETKLQTRGPIKEGY